ncbi:hypothetical protein BKA56DRAFT_589383 [Ilyonectria sp. MPI-CAGE-AT-0026]|nr:hypothetical protein BKA56DRAFT_589383 [Ilyonectria sp. MPI-CAGE-AT-0026]
MRARKTWIRHSPICCPSPGAPSRQTSPQGLRRVSRRYGHDNCSSRCRHACPCCQPWLEGNARTTRSMRAAKMPISTRFYALGSLRATADSFSGDI